MRWRSVGWLLLLIAALLTAACGGAGVVVGGKPEEKKAGATPPAVEFFHVDAATAGTVTGAIAFRGAKPARLAISMEADEGCQKAHAGNPAYDEAVIVGPRGGLANAFVYIKAGLEGKKFEPNTEAAVLDQHGCLFVPRIIGLRAGQTLDLKNGDAVAHNIHPMPANNREWNQEQAPQAATVEHRFARPEIMIPVKCNIHAWMHSYIGVVDHPYFSVTNPDGSFQWKNVPPGDYTVEVWHEKLGKQEQQVHLAAAGSAAVNFTYR
jgi:plastocyanin